ncbi:bifunctional diguanylate cyclase/phosphodiesterase [Colwellia ponticola]|uniref:cyclic-guanylate-specific phosphodiesterase n=1 Tax=Colwellia ponticola TaxID=2304625 RepID=A0A8H2PKZ0_9GAMM|nr:bifunctional diguanylate cyclase/phosphodiesterase [Colwellia ponticola]TMM43154.1 EAL domain-containing protein [Colwellia ponticola]
MEELRKELAKEKEKNALLLDIINAIPEPIFAKNWQGHFIFVNKMLAKLYNTTPEMMIGKEDTFFTGNKAQGQFFKENVQGIMRRFEAENVYEDTTDAKTGNILHFHSLKIPFKNHKEELNIVVIAKDITEITALKNTAEASAKRLKHVLEVSGEGMWDWHTQTNAVFHNSEWERITGIKHSENSFAEFQNHLCSEDKLHVNQALNALIEHNIPYDIEFRMTRPDGKEIWVWDRGQVVERDSNGKALWVVGIMQDVTQAKHDQAKINFMAFYDALTHMPNRSLLEDRLKQAMEHTKRSGLGGAVLFIDLDQFKALNDSYGHQSGDQLLIAVSKRIHKLLKAEDTVARFGGDEFVVILNDLDANSVNAALKAEVIAEEIRKNISLPVAIKASNLSTLIDYKITASIGISLFNKEVKDANQLLQLADLALYQAKANGRDDCVFFDPIMQKELSYTLELEKDLKAAIDEEHFVLHYQPQYDRQQNIVSAEALIRWDSPSKGLLYPIHFIDFAEETNLILPIGNWVITQACQQLQRWKSQPILQDLQLSVNISAKQVWHKSFVNDIIDIVKKYQVSPSQLMLEITESVVLKDLTESVAKMNQLRDFGFKMSLDDFGTGYSSLGYLKSLPIDELKIDKSFVNDITVDESDLIMVKAILDLGKNFKLNVVSEGVETQTQRDMLYDLGCNLYQGYYYSKPLPLENFVSVVQNTNALVAISS